MMKNSTYRKNMDEENEWNKVVEAGNTKGNIGNIQGAIEILTKKG